MAPRAPEVLELGSLLVGELAFVVIGFNAPVVQRVGLGVVGNGPAELAAQVVDDAAGELLRAFLALHLADVVKKRLDALIEQNLCLCVHVAFHPA